MASSNFGDIRANSYLTHCLDIDYDPHAQSPLYDQALEGIFKKAKSPEAMIRHWHELVGYIIQPQRNHAVVLILFGAGRNGKTKLIQTVTRLLGEDLVYAGRIEELENDRFSLGSLAGKLLFVDDDVRAGIKLPDGALKKISEAKAVTGERKFKDKFTFIARVVPVLLCNNVPSLPDLSHGMTRRLQVLPFQRKFTNKNADQTLFDRIWATEMSGVLNRAIEGWQRLQHRRQFKLPPDVRSANKDWLIQANPLEGFISEECKLDPAASCLMADLYAAFGLWCKESGITRPQQRPTVKRNLMHRGFTFKHSNRGQKVCGIRLLHYRSSGASLGDLPAMSDKPKKSRK